MKIKDVNRLTLIWGGLSKEGLSYLRNKANKHNFVVLVPENRPYLLGLNYNIPLLEKEKIDLIYCSDNMLGFLFYKEKIEETILFCKEMAEKEVLGICGSLYVALLSKLHNIPVKVFLQGKVDFSGRDKDASALQGRKMVLDKDLERVEKGSDEMVAWEVLR